MDQKRFSCYAGSEEVSKSHTRNESLESIPCRQGSTQAMDPSLSFETQDRHHQKANTGIPAGLMSLNLILKSIIYQGESDDSSERPSGLFVYQIPVCSTQRKRLFIWKTMSHCKSEKLHGQCNTLLGKLISLFIF